MRILSGRLRLGAEDVVQRPQVCRLAVVERDEADEPFLAALDAAAARSSPR